MASCFKNGYATEVDFEIYDMGPISSLHGR